MIHVDLVDALSGLDDELLDDYLTRRAENRKRLKRRRMIRKRCLTAAACLLVVLSVMAKAAFDCRYPYIPLENAVGDVSVRYVPEWMIGHANVSQIPDYSEYELFERANCVFSGTVSKIEHIKISMGKNVAYSSVVTIQVDRYYKGYDLTEIRLLTSPIMYRNQNSESVLHYVKEGKKGIFISKRNMDDFSISADHSSLSFSDLADVRILDDYCCAFLYEEMTDQFLCYDTIRDDSKKFFTSLATYTPESVSEYIIKMTNTD